MRRSQGTLIAGALLLVGFAGCSSTLQGAKEDAAKDAGAVGAATQEAGQALQNDAKKAAQAAREDAKKARGAAKNAAGAAETTPAVKLAIVADPVLNDHRNHINVDTVDGIVRLAGHVTSESSKRRATEDAQKALDDQHSSMQIHNDLTIQP